MKLAFVVFQILLLSACGRVSSAKDGDVIGDIGGAGVVAIHYLKDGTKCAVLIGGQKGAITCDWAGPKRKVSE